MPNAFAQQESGYFITKWTTTGTNETITFYGVGDYDIDWGDNSGFESAAGTVSHEYAVANTYTVKISNTITSFSLRSGETGSTINARKLSSMVQWETARWTTMRSAFSGARNMVYEAEDKPDLSIVTGLSLMFDNANAFKNGMNILEGLALVAKSDFKFMD